MGASGPSRREFARRSAGLVTGGLVAGAWPGALAAVTSAATSCAPGADRAAHEKRHLFETEIDVRSLTADGASLITPTEGFDGTPILVIRSSARQYVALSTQCTHEGCPVKAPVGGIIKCPCHGSEYDMEGNVRHGPAQFPLARYQSAYHEPTGRILVAIDE